MSRKTKPVNKQANKVRVVLDMSPGAVKRLDKLKADIEAESRAAVVRNALQIYEWLLQEVAQSGKEVFVGKKPDSLPSTLTHIKIFFGG